MEKTKTIKKTLKGLSLLSLAAGIGVATSGCKCMSSCGNGSCGKGSCGGAHEEGKSSCGNGSCGGKKAE